MEEETMLRIESVAAQLDVNYNTINRWYWFKEMHPENEYAKMLPNYVWQRNNRRMTRFWKQSDIEKLRKFKEALPKGKHGILGDVTQKYYRNTKRRKTDEEKKED